MASLGDTIQATTLPCLLWGWDGVMLTDGAVELGAQGLVRAASPSRSREPGLRAGEASSWKYLGCEARAFPLRAARQTDTAPEDIHRGV